MVSGRNPSYWTLIILIYHAGDTKTEADELEEPNYNSNMLSITVRVGFGIESSIGESDSIVE